MKLKFTNVRIAGVSFDNEPEDGGESRQVILATMPKYIKVNLRHTVFDNEDAIKCIESKTKKVIGWIPKTLIQELWTKKSMTGIVNNYKNTYSVSLMEQENPTRNQYWAVKKICEKNPSQLPVYDKRAYTQFIINNRKGLN